MWERRRDLGENKNSVIEVERDENASKLSRAREVRWKMERRKHRESTRREDGN